MNHLSAHELTTVFFALSALLAIAKLSGELLRKLGQPSVVGEIAAGVLLGPTVFGRFLPHAYSSLFPANGNVATVLDGVAALSVVFFLLSAGLEMSLHNIFLQGKRALLVSFFGGAIPFATGLLAAESFPQMLGAEPSSNRHLFALFVATALSISALPVIAKTLMDLRLLETDLGAVVISSAMIDDLIGWILFGIIMGTVGATSGVAPRPHTWPPVLRTALTVLIFVAITLTAGKWLICKALCAIQAHTRGQGAALGLVFSLALAGAAFAEYAGVHAIFGAFIVAIAIGDALPATNMTPPRQAGISGLQVIPHNIRQIVTNVFAPLFFASISLHTDFAVNFSVPITIVLIVVASAGKILGAGWGARLAGMDVPSSWATGFAMNARGAMEIVLGMLALRAGLIGERMFVALVVMALFTSLISGPAIQASMNRARAAHGNC